MLNKAKKRNLHAQRHTTNTYTHHYILWVNQATQFRAAAAAIDWVLAEAQDANGAAPALRFANVHEQTLRPSA